jgi:hypothetical protein
VRRVLEESAELQLVGMDWDERWAEVKFREPRWGVEELRSRLIAAGAWCAVMEPSEAGQ